MKCPKCDGTLLVISTPNGSLDGKDCMDINLECSKNDEHTFFTRIREEDLIEVPEE